mgnify:CR=1 FL=1
MSPEQHERAVEIFETTIGVEYSDQAERTPEWDDAVAKAEENTPATTVTITFASCIPSPLLDRVTAFAADLRRIPTIDVVDVIAIRTCRSCGCTDDQACFGGCWWISDNEDLCSACAPAVPGEQR